MGSIHNLKMPDIDAQNICGGFYLRAGANQNWNNESFFGSFDCARQRRPFARVDDRRGDGLEPSAFFQQFFVLTGSSRNCDALTHSYVSSPVSENDLRTAEPVSFKQSVRTIAHATPKRRGAKA